MMNSIDCAGIEKNNNYVKYHFFELKEFVYVNYSCINPSQTNVLNQNLMNYQSMNQV